MIKKSWWKLLLIPVGIYCLGTLYHLFVVSHPVHTAKDFIEGKCDSIGCDFL